MRGGGRGQGEGRKKRKENFHWRETNEDGIAGNVRAEERTGQATPVEYL